MSHDIDIHFIVGMARGGTTALGRILGTHPDITVVGETSFFGRWYIPPRSDGTYGASEIDRVRRIQRQRNWCDTTGDSESPLAISGEEYAGLIDTIFRTVEWPVTPSRLFEHMLRGVAALKGTDIVVEKTPHHVHWIERLAEAFPRARFVVGVRDPYEVVHSLRHMGHASGISRALARHPLVCAATCRAYQRSIAAALQRYPDRITVVSNEVLRRDVGSEGRRVQRFLGVKRERMLTETSGGNSSFRPGQRTGVSADEVFWVNLLCRETTKYGRRPVTLDPFRILGSIILAPAALVAAVWHLPLWDGRVTFAYLTRWLRGPARQESLRETACRSGS